MQTFEQWLEKKHPGIIDEDWKKFGKNALLATLAGLSTASNLPAAGSPKGSPKPRVTQTALDVVKGKTTYDNEKNPVEVSADGSKFTWENGVEISMGREGGGTGVTILVPDASHGGDKLEKKIKFAYSLYKNFPRGSDFIYSFTDEPPIKTEKGIQKHGRITRHKVFKGSSQVDMGAGVDASPQNPLYTGTGAAYDSQKAAEPAWQGGPVRGWSGNIPSWVTPELVARARRRLTFLRNEPVSNAEAVDEVIAQGMKQGLKSY